MTETEFMDKAVLSMISAIPPSELIEGPHIGRGVRYDVPALIWEAAKKVWDARPKELNHERA